MLAALISAAVLAAKALPSQPSFAGVTLGETVQELLLQRGDPALISASGGVTTYGYLTFSGNALQSVRIVHGNVVSVEVYTLPSGGPMQPGAMGIHLYDSAQIMSDFAKTHTADTPGPFKEMALGPYRGDDG